MTLSCVTIFFVLCKPCKYSIFKRQNFHSLLYKSYKQSPSRKATFNSKSTILKLFFNFLFFSISSLYMGRSIFFLLTYNRVYKKVLSVYTHSMATIYLSLSAQLAKSTFFIKSPVLNTSYTVAVLRYLIFYGFCIPRVAENQSFFSYY